MQTAVMLKEKLHHYIDIANDDKLQAIYVLLENEINWHYTPENIKELNNRREKHLKGESKSLTMQESFDLTRNQSK